MTPPDATSDGPIPETDYAQIRDFLFDEGAALDARRYAQWLAYVAPEIEYRIVARVIRQTSDEPQEFVVLDDRRTEIEMRVRQISDPKLSFAENPAPLTRRFVTNIRAWRDTTSSRFRVDSNLLLYRQDESLAAPYLISAQRRDILTRADGAMRLLRRHVRLDQSVVASGNLPTFL